MLAITYLSFYLFFFNAPATTEIYTLSLHDALPISVARALAPEPALLLADEPSGNLDAATAAGLHELLSSLVREDRKSTRLNSSHSSISYAVFCLKKKKNKTTTRHHL